MNEQLQFIEGGVPLTNRVWFEISEESTGDRVIDIIREHIQSIPQTLTLEPHFFINTPSQQVNNNLIDILKNIYQFKIGYEKSFPLVSIYYPYDSFDTDILERINSCDLYRPGIRVYLMVREKDLPADAPLGSMRQMAEKLFNKVYESYEIGLDTTIYFLLEENAEKLDQIFELRKLTYTWDTSINIKKPLIQVSPRISSDKNIVQKLGRYILKEKESIGVLDTICGLTSLLIRYNENKDVPAKYVPLGGCGSGISERKYCGNGSYAPCFFSTKFPIKEDAYKVCKTCVHVANCTGCLLMCNDFDECKLKTTFDIYKAMVF